MIFHDLVIHRVLVQWCHVRRCTDVDRGVLTPPWVYASSCLYSTPRVRWLAINARSVAAWGAMVRNRSDAALILAWMKIHRLQGISLWSMDQVRVLQLFLSLTAQVLSLPYRDSVIILRYHSRMHSLHCFACALMSTCCQRI